MQPSAALAHQLFDTSRVLERYNNARPRINSLGINIDQKSCQTKNNDDIHD